MWQELLVVYGGTLFARLEKLAGIVFVVDLGLSSRQTAKATEMLFHKEVSERFNSTLVGRYGRFQAGVRQLWTVVIGARTRTPMLSAVVAWNWQISMQIAHNRSQGYALGSCSYSSKRKLVYP